MATYEEIKKLYDKVYEEHGGKAVPGTNLQGKFTEMVYGYHIKNLIRKVENSKNYDGSRVKIADIGCGLTEPIKFLDGDLLDRVDYEGLEINTKLIKLANDYWKDRNNINVYEYNIGNELNKNYDIIVMNDVLPYFDTDKIIDLIKYYYTKVNSVFECTLYEYVTEEDNKKYLLERIDTYKIANTIMKEYPRVIVSKDAPPDRLRLEIYKDKYTLIEDKNIADLLLEE